MEDECWSIDGGDLKEDHLENLGMLSEIVFLNIFAFDLDVFVKYGNIHDDSFQIFYFLSSLRFLHLIEGFARPTHNHFMLIVRDLLPQTEIAEYIEQILRSFCSSESNQSEQVQDDLGWPFLSARQP